MLDCYLSASSGGDVVWFEEIVYLFKLLKFDIRVSGVLVRKGGEWKFS